MGNNISRIDKDVKPDVTVPHLPTFADDCMGNDISRIDTDVIPDFTVPYFSNSCR